MADELTNIRANLQRQNREAQGALQDLLSEREQFRQEMSESKRFDFIYFFLSPLDPLDFGLHGCIVHCLERSTLRGRINKRNV